MFYVNMIDKALSGWGCARRGRSLLIVECATLYQAEMIEQAARQRSEMVRISVTEKPRRGQPGDHVARKPFAEMTGPWRRFYNPDHDRR